MKCLKHARKCTLMIYVTYIAQKCRNNVLFLFIWLFLSVVVLPSHCRGFLDGGALGAFCISCVTEWDVRFHDHPVPVHLLSFLWACLGPPVLDLPAGAEMAVPDTVLIFVQREAHLRSFPFE